MDQIILSKIIKFHRDKTKCNIERVFLINEDSYKRDFFSNSLILNYNEDTIEISDKNNNIIVFPIHEIKVIKEVNI